MSKSNLVRASRDGDQFHYLWAARRCLLLLLPTSGLVAITIEGASRSEVARGSHIVIGEEVIDVAEYYGSEDIKHATLVRYIQLKHSTLRASKQWTPSGLKTTLEGFAKRYEALQDSLQTTTLNNRLELWFVMNRPISPSLLESVDDAAKANAPRHPADFGKLEKIVGFKGVALSDFCKLLRFEGNEEGYWDQRAILVQDVRGYLADSDGRCAHAIERTCDAQSPVRKRRQSDHHQDGRASGA